MVIFENKRLKGHSRSKGYWHLWKFHLPFRGFYVKPKSKSLYGRSYCFCITNSKCIGMLLLSFFHFQSLNSGTKLWPPLPYKSLGEGNEQQDQPNSQTSMQRFHACASYFLVKNTTAYHFGRNVPSSPSTKEFYAIKCGDKRCFGQSAFGQSSKLCIQWRLTETFLKLLVLVLVCNF